MYHLFHNYNCLKCDSLEDRLVLVATGKLLSKSQLLQKRIVSGIVMHTCNLITLEA